MNRAVVVFLVLGICASVGWGFVQGRRAGQAASDRDAEALASATAAAPGTHNSKPPAVFERPQFTAAPPGVWVAKSAADDDFELWSKGDQEQLIVHVFPSRKAQTRERVPQVAAALMGHLEEAYRKTVPGNVTWKTGEGKWSGTAYELRAFGIDAKQDTRMGARIQVGEGAALIVEYFRYGPSSAEEFPLRATAVLDSVTPPARAAQ